MDTNLQTIKQLVVDGQPTFGVFHKVETVNYLDYHSHLLSNKVVANWRKKLKANQFCFIQIYQPPYRICVAVATLNWVTSSFCYLYNSDTDQMELVEALQPLTRNTRFNESTYNGQIEFNSHNLSIKMTFAEQSIKLAIDSSKLVLSADLHRQADPLSVCTPTGKTGWTYTQKEPLLTSAGQLLIGKSSMVKSVINKSKLGQAKVAKTILEKTFLGKRKETAIDLAGATATLDWSLGYMRRVTNWHWACISGYLKDGRHFAMNLATGVNESGASENACWLDGQRYHLPAVMFKRDKSAESTKADSKSMDTKNNKQPWQVSNQALNWSKVKIDLTFVPVNCYQKSDRLVVVDTIFEQWLGHYSGTIELDGEIVEIDKMMGLAEDHYAKW